MDFEKIQHLVIKFLLIPPLLNTVRNSGGDGGNMSKRFYIRRKEDL